MLTPFLIPARTIAALTLVLATALPALAQNKTYEIRQPTGKWQVPGEIKQPTGPWQVPGDIQVPKATAPDERPDAPAGRADGSYTAVPWRWGRELRLMSEEAMAVARRVRARALILHGALDRTASAAGAQRLARALAGPSQVRLFARSGHVLPLDVEGPAVCDAIVSFFQEA